jgi:hypothetical protein
LLRRLEASHDEERTTWRSEVIITVTVFVLFFALPAIVFHGEPLLIAISVLVFVFVTIWKRLENRARFWHRRRAIESALRADRVRELRIEASRCVTLEPIEDEGACYAFETAPDEVVILHGQLFDPIRPTARISVVEVLDDDGRIHETSLVQEGEPLEPVRVIAANVKKKLDLPHRLAVLALPLDALETALAREVDGERAR